MNSKKNIDRLFQEKFKDFEVAPPDFIWQNLEAQLEERKKKRRALPLWLKLSGVAAVLIIGMFILVPFPDNSGRNNNGPAVVGTQEMNSDGSPKIAPTDNPIRQGQTLPDTEVASGGEGPAERGSSVKAGGGIKGNNTTPATHYDDAVASEGNKAPTPEAPYSAKKKRSINAANTKQEAVAYNRNRNSNKGKATSGESNYSTGTKETNNKNSIAPATYGEAIAGAEKHNDTYNSNTGINNNNQSNIARNNAEIKREEGIAGAAENNDREKGTENATDVNKVVTPQEIKDEAVAQNETVIDSAKSADTENELEKLLQQKLNGADQEKTEVAEAVKKNKWNIKPQMAPLFFNTASEGSPIDANLAANTKDFDSDMSYGVGLNYAISDRITIRSGINTVNMKYSTNDVAYYATIETEPLETVASPGGATSNLVVGSSPAGNTEATSEVQTQEYSGSLVQKMGFVEVPLEMSYKLINRRFGIDLIGGVSTLFLNDNNVTLLSDKGFSSNMGEATNINSVSFSTNVGVGFKYRFFNSFEASFEPMFKYQLNTFSNNDGNFKPYFIGLYSGISFSF